MNSLALYAILNDQVLASGSSSDDGGSIGLVFLLSGFVFYGIIYFRYRNSNKRHHHESETEATLLNMQEDDQLVQHKTGLRNSKMSGANNHEVRGARQKFF